MRGIALALLAAIVAAEETRLEWCFGPRTDYELRRILLAQEPPAGVEPPDSAATLFYGRTDLGTAGLLVALDPSDESTRLWVDRDFDGKLAGEEPLALQGGLGVTHWTIRLAVPFGDRREDLPVYLYWSDADEKVLRYTPLAHREGTVVVGHRLRKVVVVDRDGDLRFESADVFLDTDGDGVVDRREESTERIEAGVPFRLGSRGYVLEKAGFDELRFGPSETVPAAPRRAWRSEPVPRSGVRLLWARPRKLKDLKEQYEAETDRAKELGFAVAWGRTNLIGDVGRVGTPEAFEFLYKLQRTEKETEIRVAAVEAMGYAHYADAAPKVEKIARTGKPPEVRLAAIAALHAIGHGGRAALYESLVRYEKEEQICEAAARHLAYTGDAGALATLRELALTLPRPDHRVHLYRAATRYTGTRPPAEFVLQAARDRDPRMKAAALQDALELGLPEARAIALAAAAGRDDDKDLRLAIVEALGRDGDPEAVAAALPLAEGATPAVRGRLIDLLRPVRGDSLATIAGGLDHRAPEVRSAVAEILAMIPEPVAADALLARLPKEHDEEALVALVRALGTQRAVAAAADIVAAAKRSVRNAALQHAALAALGRIGFDRPEVAAYYAERFKARDWEERVDVLDAAAESGDPAAASVLLDGLADEAWQVRLAAVQGLGRVRVKEAVPPLIRLLEREEMVRVKRAAEGSLFRVTGMNLYDVTDLWWRWWNEHGSTFTVPAEVPRHGESKGGGRTVATFYGLPVESERIVFVIDRSGSMGGGELEKAVAETLNVVKRLPKTARINVLLFDHGWQRWKRGLTKATDRNRADLTRFLERQQPGGGTNIYDPLEEAVKTKGVDTVYLLSDGMPGSGKFTRTEDIAREIAELNRRRQVVIHAVALGYSSALLSKLADENGGTCVTR